MFTSLLLSAIVLSAPIPQRVACVGDSITYGAGLPDRENLCYPAQLQSRLGEGYEVRNFGHSGATAQKAGDIPYWKTAEFDAAKRFQPNTVILTLGTNDSKPQNWVSAAAFKTDVKAIISAFQALDSKPRILLGLVPPAFEGSGTIRGGIIQDQIVPALREIAYETGVEMVDFYTPMVGRNDLFPDSIHPNSFGGEVMAKVAYEAFARARDKGFDVETGLAKAGIKATKSSFGGYNCFDFVFEGRNAKIVSPHQAAKGRPFAWRAEFFGHEPQTDLMLLERGYHIVYVDTYGMMGGPPAMKIWEGYLALLKRLGLPGRFTLMGFSRGGIYAYNWAMKHPKTVECIYGDAPVCDFKSWPGAFLAGKRSDEDWAAVLKYYGFKNDAEALAFKGNPVDGLAPLAKAKVPILHVVGEADVVVPVGPNTNVVEERYRKLGGEIEVIRKPGVDHHPHSLANPTPIVEFILRHSGQWINFAQVPATSSEYRSQSAGWGDLSWRQMSDRISKEARERGSAVDVVLLGDSITQGWGREASVLGRELPGLTFLNAGISGDRTQHLLWRISHGNLATLSPKAVVLTIGINNIGAGDSASDTAEGIKALVAALLKALPSTKVVLVGPLPSGKEPTAPWRVKVNAVHKAIASLGDGRRVIYTDVRGVFLLPSGSANPSLLGGDTIHLQGAGYEAWAKALKPVLEKACSR